MQQSSAHSMTLFAVDALDETSHQGSPRCQAGCACLKNIPIESNKHTNRIIPAVALFKQDTLLPWQLQPLSLEAAPSTALWLARLGLWAFHLLASRISQWSCRQLASLLSGSLGSLGSPWIPWIPWNQLLGIHLHRIAHGTRSPAPWAVSASRRKSFQLDQLVTSAASAHGHPPWNEMLHFKRRLRRSSVHSLSLSRLQMSTLPVSLIEIIDFKLQLTIE